MALSGNNQEGVVITKNDTINGIVKVDFHQNLIIIRKGNSYMTMYAPSVKEVIAVGGTN